METTRRSRLLTLLVAAAVLLPALHVHPGPPPASWAPAAPTFAVAPTPCLACSLSREGSVPVTTVPVLPAAEVTVTLTAPVLAVPAPRRLDAAPLPARGPPTA